MTHPAARVLLPLALLTLGTEARSQAIDSSLRLYGASHKTDVRLVDATGAIVHVWQTQFRPAGVDFMPDGSLLRGIRLPGTGLIGLLPAAGGGVQRHAFDGTLLWDFRYNSEGVLSHHDVEPLPNGNVLLIAWESKTMNQTLGAGRDPALLVTGAFLPDHLVEVKPTGPTTGTIVWEWHVWDHLIQDHDPTKANFGVVASHPELVDINFPHFPDPTGQFNHCNSVDYDPIHDWILLSVPRQEEIWIIDHSTTTAEAASHTGGRWGKGGDLLYRWGNPPAYRAGPASSQILRSQHAAQFIPSGYPGAGNVTVFNNYSGTGGSSVLEVCLPLDATGNFILQSGSPYGPVAPVWSYSAPGFFSPIKSSAERLPGGNTLICSAEQDWIFEVSPAGQMVWEHRPGQGSLFQAHHTRRSLWADVPSVAAAQGGRVNFDLLQATQGAGDLYLLLCSAAGTTPGTTLFGVNVPLNFDPFLQASAAYPNAAPTFIQTFGTLGVSGEGSAAFTLPAGLPGGYQLDFAYLLIQSAPLMLKAASHSVPVQIL